MVYGIVLQSAALLVELGVTQSTAQTGSFNPLLLFSASIAWAAIWIQLVVREFYKKGESLHKDYWASGKINTALAAIEAGNLIPAISKMFIRVIEAQPDKRKRPEKEIEALLQSVTFLPDLDSAQNAVRAMQEIKQSYNRLKVYASRLWKWGLCHVILTPLLSVIYILLMPLDSRWQWVFVIVMAAWLLTLFSCVAGLFRFHSRIEQFISALEVVEATGEE